MSEKNHDLKYRDWREEFASDEEFANFRGLQFAGGESNWFFRSAGLYDDTYGRAFTATQLAWMNGIRTILYLSEIVTESSGNRLWLDEGRCLCLGPGWNWRVELHGCWLIQGLTRMLELGGPYLIACRDGLDRTGFVTMLLEALGGTPIERLLDDYMLSYRNNCGLDPERDAQRYREVRDGVALARLRELVQAYGDGFELNAANLRRAATEYLRRHGMSEKSLEILEGEIRKGAR